MVDNNSREVCGLALDTAVEMCDDMGVVFERMARVAGLSDREYRDIGDITNSYAIVLSQGVGDDDLSVETRKWVLARSCELVMNDRDIDVFTAFGMAWGEARDKVNEKRSRSFLDEPEYEPDYESDDEFDDLDSDEDPGYDGS